MADSVFIEDDIKHRLPVLIDKKTANKNPELMNLLLDLSKNHLMDNGASRVKYKEYMNVVEKHDRHKRRYFQALKLLNILEEEILNDSLNEANLGSEFSSIIPKNVCRRLREVLNAEDCSKLFTPAKDNKDQYEPLDLDKSKYFQERHLLPKEKERVMFYIEKVLENRKRTFDDMCSFFLGAEDLKEKNVALETEIRECAIDIATLKETVQQVNKNIVVLIIDVTKNELLGRKYQNDKISTLYHLKKADAMGAKTHKLKNEILCDTYSKEVVDCHKLIRENLDQQLDQALSTHVKLKTRINDCENVGLGFKEIAEQYGNCLEKIKDLEWQLSTLNSVGDHKKE